jgi:RNA polymerase II-associated factor 1
MSAPIDVSRTAQLRDIEASFAACNDNFCLSSIRHSNKPDVTAIESYEVFPDSDIWANAYDLFRFSERPGDKPIEVCLTCAVFFLEYPDCVLIQAEDPRLDCAILRPMESDGDHFLAYYLTQDDESALKLKETRFALPPYEVPEEEKEVRAYAIGQGNSADICDKLCRRQYSSSYVTTRR